ncbi:glycoside hydrolase [Zopfochytrium polystomum]|nr:glycoside hydrolase [Zopfochytrium polystomum]
MEGWKCTTPGGAATVLWDDHLILDSCTMADWRGCIWRTIVRCHRWRLSVVMGLVAFLLAVAPMATALSDHRRLLLRDGVKEMFYHGYNSYMDNAFPMDELNPISCSGRGPDRSNPDNIHVNDVLGGYSLTLVDTLDVFGILGDRDGFEEAVRLVIKHVNFAVDSRVSVFEVTIRMLGGLLSAHLLAIDKEKGMFLPWYEGELLDLAFDLGSRLLPAFDTPTKIPYPRVNLLRGVLRHEVNDTCTAGAGSLILEFGTLSRLSGIRKFERVAKNALLALWERRSGMDLIGDTIDIQNGKWIQPMAGVGAGMDSFYEYLLKAYVLFGDSDYLEVFSKSYTSLMKNIKEARGLVYRNVNMNNGALYTSWIDSLSAFFPGLQVLAGDVASAEKGHRIFFALWRRYHGLPERFDFNSRSLNIPHYPLRPEFAESTYFLYQATKNPYYLLVGESIVRDINSTMRTMCGFASVRSVADGSLDDRMESFFLSETLKYLYLLFDTDNLYNRIDSNVVFTTGENIHPH